MRGIQADEKPELIYFPCFGRAGVTKLCFRLGNVDFVDTLEAWDTWWTRKTGEHAEISENRELKFQSFHSDSSRS